MSTDATTRVSGESEVWNAIAAFERILEAMPNDRVALETLFDAYGQIGQTPKSIEYLVRLGQCVLDENDMGAAPGILAKLRDIAGEDEVAQEMADQLKEMLGDLPESEAAAAHAPSDAKHKTIDITNELSLAWNLVQAQQLTQAEYSGVVHDLSELSAKEQESTISVLHILQQRAFPDIDKVVGFLAKDSGVPVVSLAPFEIQPQAFNALPLDFMVREGAIVFEIMGRELLVGVVNPYDADLREQVQQTTGRKCHFYLVTPADFDATIESIQQTLLTPAD